MILRGVKAWLRQLRLLRNRRAMRNDQKALAPAIAAGIVFGYAVSLVLLFQSHVWILDAQGRPQVQDFLSFWSAGKLALHGAAVRAYDPDAQHAAEVANLGHGFAGALEWNYPPAFFFIVAPLAALPFASAFVIWCVATLAAYAATVAKIARRADAAIFACAAPPVLAVWMSGQNGLLTAALVGLALLFIEKRPALGGIVLGLLSYKPQFGLLFPLALAAGGYWRAFLWAGASAVAANGAAVVMFGGATLDGFLHAMRVTGDMRIAHAGMGWNKLQSLYALARSLGLSGTIAWSAQALLSALIALAVVACWRAPLSYVRKASVLAAAIPLVTPYILVYDLPMLAVAAAFLYRERAFDRSEIALLVSTVPSVMGLLWLPVPSAFFASLAVGAIVLKRCYATLPLRRINLGRSDKHANSAHLVANRRVCN